MSSGAVVSNMDPEIAVVGLACRFPGAADAVQLWENVVAGRQQFRSIPARRMPLRDYHSTDPKDTDKSYARKAAVIDGFRFDWVKAKVPRATFESTDISHWLALTVAEAAMRSAGYEGSPPQAERFGVVVGNTLTGEQVRANSMRLRWPYVRSAFLAALGEVDDPVAITELLARFEREFKDPFPPMGEDSLAGSLSNTIAGRICSRFDLGGGGYTVDAACASSLLAVATAADRLLAGDLDMALAGGVDISLDPFELVGFARAGALARGAMRVYDQRAGGFVPGEGCGFVVLKRFHDAVGAGDRIFAVIRGWGVSSDGRHPIMAPRLDGQVRALERAYARAGLDPGVVDFVEGHGTGTALGDRTEITALGTVIGSRADHPVGVTSLKAALGHCKAAAGIGALIKALIGVNRRCLPPVPGCERPSKVFSEVPGQLFPARLGSLLGDERAPVAGVSAMGFGGINVHVVVQAAGPPAPELAPRLPERVLLASRQDSEVFVLDASSWSVLQERVDELRDMAVDMSTAEIIDLAATWARREGGGPVRAVVVADSEDVLTDRLELLRRLVATAREGVGHRSEPGVWVGEIDPSRPPRIGLLFPGQGSQRVGAGRFLVDRFDWASATASMASRLAAELGIPDLLAVLHPHEIEGADDSRLTDTRLAQPSVCLVSVLWMKLLRELGITPVAATGHSLGELGALHAAGFIDERELLQLATVRGAVVAEHAEPGAMVALGASLDEANALLVELPTVAAIANINGARRVVVSVEPRGVDLVLRAAKRRGIAATTVPVSHGFHSDLVVPAARTLHERVGDGARTSEGAVAFVSGVRGTHGTQIDSLGEHLARHLCLPVDFRAQLQAIARVCDVLVELGPGDVLTRLARAELGTEGPAILALEPAPSKFAALQGTLAELYVRGGVVRWGQLYEQRLVRPFVPAAEREFITNPCGERSTSPLYELLPEAPRRVAEAAPDPAGDGSELSLAAIRGLIAERTGFPLEIVTEHSRLLDDLNLDSIKSGEIIVAAAALAGVAEHVDPMALTNATVGDLYRALVQVRAHHGGSATTESLRLGPWVRNFSIERRLEPLAAAEGSIMMPRVSALWIAGRAGPWSEAQSRSWAPRRDVPPELSSTAPSGVAVLVVDRPTGDAWEWATLLVEPLGHLCRVAQHVEGVVVIEAAERGEEGSGVPSSSLIGFLRSLALEHPHGRIRLIHADRGIDAAAVVGVVQRSWGQGAGFAYVELGGDGRAWRHQAVPLPPSSVARGVLGPTDVILVTGGGRGITYECVRALAAETGCRLALIGRSRPADSEELAANLRGLDQGGSSYHYVCADVSDREQLAVALVELEQALGPITGVVHGAGRNVPRRAHEPSLSEVLADLSPKVRGLSNVLALVRERSLRVVVGLGSVIATTGMHGNAWYAFSNELLSVELAAFGRACPQCRVLSVDFGAWAEVGMAARLGTADALQHRGLSSIEPDEGSRRFVKLVLDEGSPSRVLVSGPVDPSTWPGAYEPLPHARFVSQDALVCFPGVECRTRVELDVSRDPRLLDHRYQGTLLWPAVFGIEAMAQSARVAVGGRGWIRSLTDIELEHPVVVPEDRAMRIEIRARVEEEPLEGSLCVLASVRSESTGYVKDHFRAKIHFELGPEPDVSDLESLETTADPHLCFDARRDLYGPLLFQGPHFHWIGRILGLESRDVVFALEPPTPDADELDLLGSPASRDALLQGGQVLVPQADALPERIARIELCRARAPTGPGLCHVRLTASHAEGFLVDAVRADSSGRIHERMEGARFRRLRSRPDRPSLEQLRSPEREGTAALQQSFVEAGYDARVGLVFEEGLDDAPRSTRHAVLERVLAELVGEGEDGPRAVTWTEQGPRLDDESAWISVSHDGSFGIAVESRHRLGVDLQSITARAPELWRGLLGRDHGAIETVGRLIQGDDEAATRVWAAREALFKLTQTHGLALSVLDARGAHVGLEASVDDRRVRISTWRVHLGRGPARIVALAMPETRTRVRTAPEPARSERALVESRPGTPGRTAVVHRVVTSFADCIDAGTVPASRLASWMGHARELALLPLRDELLPRFESGRFGAVTNYAYVELLAPLGAMIEVEVVLEATHVDETSASMALVFSRHDEDGVVIVGRAGQRFTWVEVEGGRNRPAPMPPALHEYFVGVGADVLGAPASAPVIGSTDAPVLATVRVRTTSDDSNLVGNLYFARYFRWVERVLAVCERTVRRPVRRCSMEYLREARPGDVLDVVLRAVDSRPRSMFVEVLRHEPQLGRARMAVANVEIDEEVGASP